MSTELIATENIAPIRDESLFAGTPASLSAPATVEEVCQILCRCRAEGVPVTVHGSLTAMNGAGVPTAGHSMDMRQLNNIHYDPETQTLWVQAGASFQKIRQTLRRESRHTRDFPAAPTEDTATLGGGLSFRTTGIRSLRYGTLADQVLELEYCDHTGQIHRISRDSEGFDLLLGSEGMHGILTAARLRTAGVPGCIWGLMFFFSAEETAAAFAARAESMASVTVLEFMDQACLTLLKTQGKAMAAVGKLPEIPEQSAAVYLELETDTDEQMEGAAENLLMLLEETGGDPDSSWSAAEEEVWQLRDLHHALSECINLKTALSHGKDAAVTRLTYPMRLTGDNDLTLLQTRRAQLASAGLESAVFGHWGQGRVISLYLFAADGNAMARGKELIRRWYREDIPAGRGALREPGIGKLYREIFCEEAPREQVARCREARQKSDPEQRFNPGNLFI